MEGSASVERAELESSRCAAHPERPGVALCERCGDYHCAECHKRIAGRALCARCRALPGVDYLEDARRRYWGKRDGFVWYFGVFTPLSVFAALTTVMRFGDAGHMVSTVAWLATTIAYLALYRPARLGMLVLCIVDLAVDAARAALGINIWPSEQPVSLQDSASTAAIVFGGGFVGLLLALAAYRSPRNKLAFKIAVDDRELQRVYDRYLSNPLAVRAAAYGALFMLVPLGSVFTLIMGIRALRRADPRAWPPRSGRVPALLGIAFSAIGLLGWGVVILGIIVSAHR